MILTTHALAGAVIGKNIQNPWIIILASLTVHYFLDGFRHGEYFDERVATVKNTWWKVALDLAVGFFIIIAFLIIKHPKTTEIINILLGSFFSLLPDFVTLMHWTFKKNKTLAKIKSFHAWAHRYSKFPKHSKERQWTLRNAANDILISATAILLLMLF
jgi:hypothetical protein